MKTCYIICAGDVFGIDIKKSEGDFIIAADGGLFHCRKYNISPDLVVGDFDSLGYTPDTENFIKLPVEKDDTDTSFAVKYAMKKGYKKFIIYGAVGGKRPEHTYANIALGAFISKEGGQALVKGDGYVITAVTGEKVVFNKSCKGDISVFAFDSSVTGVTEKGLKYTLNNAEMKNSQVTGISNSFTGEQAEISVKTGTLIIFYCGTENDISFVGI